MSHAGTDNLIHLAGDEAQDQRRDYGGDKKERWKDLGAGAAAQAKSGAYAVHPQGLASAHPSLARPFIVLIAEIEYLAASFGHSGTLRKISVSP